MPKEYEAYQIDVFSDKPFCGKPAGVVWNASVLPVDDMQEIVREFNNSETVFMMKPTSDFSRQDKRLMPADMVHLSRFFIICK